MNKEENASIKKWMSNVLETPPMGFTQQVMRKVMDLELERRRERITRRVLLTGILSVLGICLGLSLRLDGYFGSIQWPDLGKISIDYRMSIATIALAAGVWMIILIEKRRGSTSKAGSKS